MVEGIIWNKLEELYKRYFIIKSKKANNVINKNLTFKFNGHQINRVIVVLAILAIILIVYFQKLYYFLFLGIFITIIIVNKLSIYTVYFDNQNIIIKNFYKKHTICYKNGIEIYINKRQNANFTGESLRLLTKWITQDNESDNTYSLILKDNYDIFVLATVVNDDIVKEITQFIDNFYFDESIKKEQNYIRFQNK